MSKKIIVIEDSLAIMFGIIKRLVEEFDIVGILPSENIKEMWYDESDQYLFDPNSILVASGEKELFSLVDSVISDVSILLLDEDLGIGVDGSEVATFVKNQTPSVKILSISNMDFYMDEKIFDGYISGKDNFKNRRTKDGQEYFIKQLRAQC